MELTIAILFVALSGVFASPFEVSIYKNRFFQGGLVAHLKGNECTNLPTKEVGSMNIHDTCVIVYRDTDCNGISMKLLGGDKMKHRSLPEGTLYHDTSSIGPCPVEPYDVSLYQETFFRVPITRLSGLSCTNLPRTDIGSVDIHGTCVQVYEEPDCTGYFQKYVPYGDHYPYRTQGNLYHRTGSIGPCL